MPLKLFFVCVALLLPSFCWAEEVTLTDLVNVLEVPFKQTTANERRVHDFSGAFSQESHIASINRAQRGQGQVMFRFVAAEDGGSGLAQFRWDYQEPEIQEIISDGATLWVYLPDNKQVIESDITALKEQDGANPVTFLGDLGNLSDNFKVAKVPSVVDEKGHFFVRLEPLQPSPLIQFMVVTVHKEAVNSWLKSHKTGDVFPIVATHVTDAQGNRTLIRFDEIKVNNGFEAAAFSFQKPDDVERVTPEQMSF